jgi:hypothetical protein
MFNFYYKTARYLPSGLYSMCRMGFEWCLIYSITQVFSMSKILNTPDWKPAAKKRPVGFGARQRQLSLEG